MPEIQHLNIKLYCSTPELLLLEKAIPVFHRWIQEKILGELLIDVADYAHVPSGPGVLLIGHDAFYSLEAGPENRLGLLYNRRTKLEGTNKDRILSALKAVLHAKKLLEGEAAWEKKLRFSVDELKITVNDRYLGPNEQTTFVQLKSDFQEALDEGLGRKNTVLHYEQNDVRRRFEIKASYKT